ncbi:glutamate-rich protein 6B-like [Crassostrea angulata]|uniref:glutamate-rich protein 6B-like n=1 Tax=Magallana angulata TaxID=2784310 RepID=UPI0022B0CFB7|nr:glutamate-rich protein 6B-like [Crassostrea angulata]
MASGNEDTKMDVTEEKAESIPPKKVSNKLKNFENTCWEKYRLKQNDLWDQYVEEAWKVYQEKYVEKAKQTHEELQEKLKDEYRKKGYNVKSVGPPIPFEDYKKDMRKLGYKLRIELSPEEREADKKEEEMEAAQKAEEIEEALKAEEMEIARKAEEIKAARFPTRPCSNPTKPLEFSKPLGFTTLMPQNDSGFFPFKIGELPKRPKYSIPTPWGEWETGKERVERLKKEKMEDEDFNKQLNIQFRRRVRDNPHINFSTDNFGSGKHIKSIDEKVKDLLEDPHYPEAKFNSLKCETLLVSNELDDTRKELEDTKKILEDTQKELEDSKEKLTKLSEFKEQDPAEFIVPLFEKPPGTRMDWMKSDASRATWSFYIKPEQAKNDKFKAMRLLLSEYCHKFCLVENGVTHNINGEFQLKKPMNIKGLTDLLGPNIYINGGPKELGTENWSMAAEFDQKDYFNISFTDETKGTISKFNIDSTQSNPRVDTWIKPVRSIPLKADANCVFEIYKEQELQAGGRLLSEKAVPLPNPGLSVMMTLSWWTYQNMPASGRSCAK